MRTHTSLLEEFPGLLTVPELGPDLQAQGGGRREGSHGFAVGLTLNPNTAPKGESQPRAWAAGGWPPCWALEGLQGGGETSCAGQVGVTRSGSHGLGHTAQVTQSGSHGPGHMVWATRSGSHNLGHMVWDTGSRSHGPGHMDWVTWGLSYMVWVTWGLSHMVWVTGSGSHGQSHGLEHRPALAASPLRMKVRELCIHFLFPGDMGSKRDGARTQSW